MVELSAWWPRYLAIVERFGYSVEEDQRAADLLSGLLAGHAIPLSDLASRVRDRNVLVLGAGPSLPRNLEEAMSCGLTSQGVLIAADGAATALLEWGLQPSVIVTDLDGADPHTLLRAQLGGATVVVHAHGDNIPALRKVVPRLLRRGQGVLGSTQAMPRPGVVNLGGFTDGDRCVFLAEELGAQTIALLGMDLGGLVGRYSKPDLTGDVPANPIKREKMMVARELLGWLASRSRSRLVNLTGAAPIKGIPNHPIKPDVWKE